MVAIKVSPFIPYWTADDPWQHSHLVPDYTAAHLQLDLAKLNAASRERLQDSLPKKFLPPDLLERLPQFAGRHASLSIIPNQGYIVMFDVRDRDEALEFARGVESGRVHVKHGKLLLVSDPANVELARDYDNERNLFSISDSKQFRHAILNRPQTPDSDPLGHFFLTWNALPPELSEEVSLMIGCDPDDYVSGSISVDPVYRVDLICNALADTAPPDTVVPDDPIPPEAEFHLRAAFLPTRENVESLLSVTSMPLLAQTYLVLDAIPGDQAPYSPPLDEGHAGSEQRVPSALDDLLAALDGMIRVTVSRGRLEAYLPHHDGAAVARFVHRIEGAGIDAGNVSHDEHGIHYRANIAAQQPLPDIDVARSGTTPCPTGPQHILIYSQLSFLRAVIPFPFGEDAKICYTSHRVGNGTQASITVQYD